MVTEINIDFGNRVRSQREYCGLSQVRLGNKIGVSQGYVSKMETHGWVPSKEIVEKLTEVLQTNTDYLFNKTPVETKKEEKTNVSLINNFVAKDKLTEHDISSINNFFAKNKLKEDDVSSIKTSDVEEDEMDQSSDCKKVLNLVQKNLDHLFKVTGDQFFVSPKTSLYSISEICRHYKISPSYLFEDHEKEWLKEEIEMKYKEIEQMEAKLAAFDENK